MRHFFLLGFVAFTLSTAEAVTVGWQTTGKQALTSSTWSVATGGNSPTFSYAGNADFTAKVIYTVAPGTTLATGKAWASLFAIAASSKRYDFQTSAVGDAAKVWNNGSSSLSPDVTIRDLIGPVEEGGTLELAYRYDHSAHTLGYYVQGELVATKTEVTVGAWVTLSGGTDSRVLDRFFPLDGSVSYKVMFLPEPTALALLALGVTGLALRRKAA